MSDVSIRLSYASVCFKGIKYGRHEYFEFSQKDGPDFIIEAMLILNEDKYRFKEGGTYLLLMPEDAATFHSACCTRSISF